MSKDDPQNDFKFNILYEEVADEDYYVDKTHEKASQNLYELIELTDKGITIGLEGSWGAGKSTVIRFLNDKIQNDRQNEYFLFLFDAWAHEGDPLRRIFLESLIDKLDPESRDEKLTSFRESISLRKKTVNVNSKKSVSKLGKLLSWFALFIPFGAALLSRVDYSRLTLEWFGQPNIQFVVGSIFALSPAWIFLYWLFCGDKDKKESRRWDFFESEAEENTTQDITEDGERTSIEFEKYFSDIIKYILYSGNYNYKKFVIIVDNLDRIEPEYAKNMLSTLQTFFQHRCDFSVSENDAWRKMLWFIVPFDNDGFRSMWDGNKNKNEKKLNDDLLSTSYLYKTFQAIVEVPDPIMSNWLEYLKAKIDEAFSSWDENLKDHIFSVYKSYFSKLDESPTPRKINFSLNQIGNLALRWGNEMSISSICLYALYRQTYNSKKFRSELLLQSLPGTIASDRDNEINKELAGMLFGVSKDKGVQLLLTPEIHEALQKGDSRKLRTLEEVHGDAFWIAWDHSYERWKLNPEHNEEYKISFTKSVICGLNHKNLRERRIDNKILKCWGESHDRRDFKKFDYIETIKLLDEISKDKNPFSITFVPVIKEKIDELIKSLNSSDVDEVHFRHICEFKNYLNEIRVVDAKEYSVFNLDSWKLWIDTLERFSLKDPLVHPNANVLNELISSVNFGQPNLDLNLIAYIVKSFKYLKENGLIKTLNAKLVQWGNLNNRHIDCNDYYYLFILVYNESNEKEKATLKDCISGQHFWVRSNTASIGKNPSLPYLVSIVLGKGLQENQFLSAYVKEFWSKEGQEEDAYNTLRELNCLDTIWEMARDKKNQLALSIIKNINEEELFSEYYGANYIDDISLPENERDIIAYKLVENGAFEAILENISDYPRRYEDVVKIFYSLDDVNVKSKIDEISSSLSKEKWYELLNCNSNYLSCLNDKYINFNDAFTELMIDLIEGMNESVLSVSQLKDGYVKFTFDNESVLFPKLTKVFFDTDNDNLFDEDFESLSVDMKKYLKTLDETKVQNRVCYWLSNDKLERVKLIIESEFMLSKVPLEQLIAKMAESYLDCSDDEKQLLRKLDKKLGLQVNFKHLEKKGDVTE